MGFVSFCWHSEQHSSKTRRHLKPRHSVIALLTHGKVSVMNANLYYYLIFKEHSLLFPTILIKKEEVLIQEILRMSLNTMMLYEKYIQII